MARRSRPPNERLRAVLAQTRMSHQGLARRVNAAAERLGLAPTRYDHSSVARWLAGQQPSPQIAAVLTLVVADAAGRHLTAADLGLHRSGPAPDLGLRYPLTWADSVATAVGLWHEDLVRRRFLVTSDYATGAYEPAALRWLTAPAGQPDSGTGPVRVGAAEVDGIVEVAGLFRRLDNQWGGGHTRGMVMQYLDEQAPALLGGRYGEATGRRLAAALAELTHLAGWMAYDLEQHGLAQRHLTQALRLARAGEAIALGAEILIAMSQQAAYVDRPGEAVDLARVAQLSARRAHLPQLVAEALVTEARALAQLADRRGAVAALAAAEAAYDPDAEVPSWLAHFDDAYLSAQAGHVLRTLGELDVAEQHAHRSLRMAEGYTRGRTFNLVLLASIHAEQGEIERSCAVAGEALELAAGTTSTRARARVADVGVLLAPHRSVPAVRALTERTRALRRRAPDPGRATDRRGDAARP